MPLEQINRIPRGIAACLLVLILAATQRAEAQPPGAFQQQLTKEIADASKVEGLRSPPTTADDPVEKAWTNIGPPIKKVDYDNLPLSEVVRILQDSFSNQFDVIASRDEVVNINISLRLQDVSAAEVFNAMNLYFETGASSSDLRPRWRLLLNGSRPTAVLEVTRTRTTMPASSVFYIGDLLGNGGLGVPGGFGFQPQALFKAIQQVHNDASGDRPLPGLAFHPESGILVVTGTPEQISLTQQTLNALKQKVVHDQSAAAMPGPRPSGFSGSASPPRLANPGTN